MISSPQKYHGSCHCGEVAYEAKLALDQVITCNCSICHKKGMVLTFLPLADFTLLRGQDSLQDYQFGKKTIHHLFCKTCGIQSFGRGTMPNGDKIVAVNLRCVDGVDLNSLTITPIDGKNF